MKINDNKYPSIKVTISEGDSTYCNRSKIIELTDCTYEEVVKLVFDELKKASEEAKNQKQ